MKMLQEKFKKEYKSFTTADYRNNVAKQNEAFKRYIEAKVNNKITTYTYSYFKLEQYEDSWILTRTIDGEERRVELNEGELELLDINDIEGTLPELTYYVDMIEQKFGM